jgi:Uma2 family endonuclease
LALADVDSEPEPDVVWARRRNPAEGHPTAADVLLVIEVADSSLEIDRTEKAALYADAGIQEYWIVNLLDRAIEVYRGPTRAGYSSQQTFAADQVVCPISAPSTVLRFDSLLFRGN